MPDLEKNLCSYENLKQQVLKMGLGEFKSGFSSRKSGLKHYKFFAEARFGFKKLVIIITRPLLFWL